MPWWHGKNRCQKYNHTSLLKMAGHNQTGVYGEMLALTFLEKHGFTILEKNWRYQRKEIDLIAMDGDELVFCEVKTRKTDVHSTPSDTISYNKQNYLCEAAEAYIIEKDLHCHARFDVVVIYLHCKPPEIHHIKEAFTA